jgi:4-amino-4-deoxy-L-arabinose transferase-like glycosyltransferase/membrane-associated phospholipid phosphatase
MSRSRLPVRGFGSSSYFRSGLLLACFGVGCLVDQPVYRAMDGWYNRPVPLNGEVHQLILSLAMYGQALGIAVAIVLIFLLDTTNRGRAVALGTILAIVGLTCGVAKTLIGRERPLEAQGRTILHGPHRGLAESRNQSFPSGHAATAFSLAYCLSRFYPKVRPLVWPLAFGVGMNRVVTVRHFVSDVVAGASLGFLISHWIFRSRWLWKLIAASDILMEPGRFSPLPAISKLHWRLLGRRLASTPGTLALVSLLINWTGNADTTLWDRDEPRFATATREMLDRGNLMVPTFNGELRPDKPILCYWFMATAYQIFGDNPFGARFFSGLAGMLACLVTAQLGSNLFDRRVGLVAGWILALSPMLVTESKLATADALLLLWMTLCVASLWKLINRDVDRWSAIVFWITLALAMLTKGPVAIAIIAVIAVGFSVLMRDRVWLGRLRWAVGLTIFTLIVAPWCVAVQWQTGGDFLRVALGHHVLRRSLEPLENHHGFPGYYAVSVFALMAPWAWALPWTIKEHLPRWRTDRRIAFLAAWSLGTMVLFELVRTKLVHYYLPAYPALALLIASALVGRFDRAGFGLRRLDPRIALVLIVVGSAIGAGAAVAAVVVLPAGAAAAAAVTITVVAGGTICAGLLVARLRFQRAFVVLAATIAAGMLVACGRLLPELGRWRLVVHVAERLKTMEPRAPIALWLYRDPSIIYHIGQTLPILDPVTSRAPFPDARRFAQNQGAFVCPMTDEQFHWLSSDRAFDLSICESQTRWDLNGLKPRRIHFVMVRRAPPPNPETAHEQRASASVTELSTR